MILYSNYNNKYYNMIQSNNKPFKCDKQPEYINNGASSSDCSLFIKLILNLYIL